jgi:hypothetical protein
MKKLVIVLLATISFSNKVQSQYKNNINLNGNIYFLGLQYERSINKMFSTSLTLGFPKNYFRSSKEYDYYGNLVHIQKRRGLNHKLEFMFKSRINFSLNADYHSIPYFVLYFSYNSICRLVREIFLPCM